MSDAPRAFVWRITCNNSLVITLAVCGRHLVMLSDDSSRVNPPWRLGTYLDTKEANRRAVEMTNSYERLRAGKVTQYTEVALPAMEWKSTTEGEVHPVIAHRITEALDMSPTVSPENGSPD